MDAAEEQEVVAGLLPLTVGGRVHLVPELKWRANREWQQRIADTSAGLVDLPADSPAGQLAMADVEHDLIRAYDATGALGDLEDATETELSAVYTRLLEVSYPLAHSVMATQVLLMQAAVASARQSSTNGPLPTGPSVVPMTSRAPSRNGKRNSSGRRPRSA